MRRALGWSLVAVLLVGTTATVAAKRRRKAKGKVVRIERVRSEGVSVPRLCSQVSPDGRGGGLASCSAPVRDGEIGTVVSETGPLATVVVRSVTPQPDGCGNTAAWNVGVEVQQGSLDLASWTSSLLFDWKTHPRSRSLPNVSMIPAPSGRQGESIWAGVDDDGDDMPELMISWFGCDPTGQPALYGQGGANCYAYYKRDGAGFAELRLDVVRSCY